MTVELVSEITGRKSHLSAKAFGRLLHVARLNGWWPENAPQDWPAANWDTQILLPYVGPYIPGPVSATEALSLKKALVKASATGLIAAEGSLQIASEIVLLAARAGAFEVHCIGATQPVGQL